jgi:hypothetical protein
MASPEHLLKSPGIGLSRGIEKPGCALRSTRTLLDIGMGRYGQHLNEQPAD